jgi:hypothetical protein
MRKVIDYGPDFNVPHVPVFLGMTWTLETQRLSTGGVAGYVTHADSATTYSVGDPLYPSAADHVPPRVVARLRKLVKERDGTGKA